MKLSKYPIKTLKNDPKDAEAASHLLMLKAGFLKQITSGVFVYTPMMWRVLKKIMQIVRQEMDKAGAIELSMPILQPKELWQQTGRWDDYVKSGTLFYLKDRRKAELCLGPTHEEIITSLAKQEIQSYKDLPVNFYQITTKFRDELRPRAGLLRGREFIMKDSYSFDADEQSHKQSYEKMRQAYNKIFTRSGLDFLMIEADTGQMGGSSSHEFIVKSEAGEDLIAKCSDCNYASNTELLKDKVDVENLRVKAPCPKCQGKLELTCGIELGHLFNLGTKYSRKPSRDDPTGLSATYLDKAGKEQALFMGCYGIGIARIAACAIELFNDKSGMIWPKAIAPYQIVIVIANMAETQQVQTAGDLYNRLTKLGVEAALDDRKERIGFKLNDADLIGYPYKLIIGKSLQQGVVELKSRKSGEVEKIKVEEVEDRVVEIMKNDMKNLI